MIVSIFMQRENPAAENMRQTGTLNPSEDGSTVCLAQLSARLLDKSTG